MSLLRPLVLASVLAATSVPAVQAQQREREPMARFAADVRFVLPRFPTDTDTPTAIGVTNENLPARGRGLSAGVHVYPLRMGKVTLGVGGEFMVGRGRKTLPPETENGPEGPTVETRLSTLSPQVSLNFGTREGWSYLSVGLGRASFTTENVDDPVTDAPSKLSSLNYGGGARWFINDHLAFTFDLRFHRIPDQAPAAGRPAYAKRRITVLSAGISLK
jgi:hypothetical protein